MLLLTVLQSRCLCCFCFLVLVRTAPPLLHTLPTSDDGGGARAGPGLRAATPSQCTGRATAINALFTFETPPVSKTVDGGWDAVGGRGGEGRCCCGHSSSPTTSKPTQQPSVGMELSHPSIASRLTPGVSFGTTTVAGTPKNCAAAAIACPWLPLL